MVVRAGWAARVRRAGGLLRSECGRLHEYMGLAYLVAFLSFLALRAFWHVLPAPVRDWLVAFAERVEDPEPVAPGMAVAACVLGGLFPLALAWAWVAEARCRRRPPGTGKAPFVLIVTLQGAGRTASCGRGGTSAAA